MISGHHAVVYCPKCQCQRTFSSYDSIIYVCDYVFCRLRMRYREADGRLMLV